MRRLAYSVYFDVCAPCSQVHVDGDETTVSSYRIQAATNIRRVELQRLFDLKESTIILSITRKTESCPIFFANNMEKVNTERVH